MLPDGLVLMVQVWGLLQSIVQLQPGSVDEPGSPLEYLLG